MDCDRQQGEMGSLQEISQVFRHVVINFLSLLFLSDSPFGIWLIASGMMDVFIVSPAVPGGWWQSKG